MVDVYTIDTEVFFSKKKINPIAFYCNEDYYKRLVLRIQSLIDAHICFKEESISYQHTPTHNARHSHAPQSWQGQGGPRGMHPAGPKHDRHADVRGPGGMRPQHKRFGHGHNVHGGHGHHSNNSHGNHHRDWNAIHKPRTIVGGKTDPFVKEITSLLNKITPSSFELIRCKLVAKCSHVYDPIVEIDENVPNNNPLSVIITLVLNKCIRDECFMDMYMNIIESMQSCLVYQAQVERHLTDFVYNYIDSMDDALEQIQEQEHHTDYDSVCAFFKLKKKFAAQNKCVIRMIEKGMIQYTFASYAHILLNKLDAHCESITKVDTLTQAVYDMFEMLHDHREINAPVFNVDIVSHMQQFHKDHVLVECGMNTRFKWDVMMDRLGRKHYGE